jgi:hypothetical protein
VGLVVEGERHAFKSAGYVIDAEVNVSGAGGKRASHPAKRQ